jgi:hypothetical protein
MPAMKLLRRNRQQEAAATAVADSRTDDIEETLDELRDEIATLTDENRSSPDRDRERRLLRARHLAGIRLLDGAPGSPRFADPTPDLLRAGDPLPELSRDELTPGLLRAGILRDGCVLVRELVPRSEALRFADEIDHAYALREPLEDGGSADGYYEEFEPHPRFEPPWRPWIKMGGGLLAADSPQLTFQMMELFDGARLPELVSGYLGEPALISTHKTTLRKAEPEVGGAWHQDGYFMGPVRALNLWLSLSRCGDEAPGLDIVPRRLDDYLATGTEGADLKWTISDQKVDEVAAGAPVIRPIFEPGDALFFDELFLHRTGSDPSMPKPRFAIENWFFGGSAFPGEYAPIAV